MAPWIKMRTDLRRHPKVVRMASALGADRYRVIGGLLAVWAVFDEQTEDGYLEGYTPQAMDDEIGWPGFSAAMIGVAWLSFQEQAGLAMPEFDEHNGQSAKRRASDTKRKRNERESEESPQPVRAVSASNADKKTTRGRGREKDSSSLRSEEVSASALGIPPGLLADWLVVRKAKKVGKLTETAAEMLRREAEKAGIGVQQAIEACCQYGWGGFNAGWYADRMKTQRVSPLAPNKHSAAAAAIFGPSAAAHPHGEVIDV